MVFSSPKSTELFKTEIKFRKFQIRNVFALNFEKPIVTITFVYEKEKVCRQQIFTKIYTTSLLTGGKIFYFLKGKSVWRTVGK